MFVKNLDYDLPDKDGFFGEFGGAFVSEDVKKVLDRLDREFQRAIEDEGFLKKLQGLLRDYCGRPTPLYYATRLSQYYGRGRIYLKREDLNHTGAHKITNAVGQALLARRMGAKKVVAETGAGQNGVASATAAALLGMECEIFMGEKDIARQQLNVQRMKLLGAKVHSVDTGTKTLSDAYNAAIDYWITHNDEAFYIVGSAVGPHPYPKIVRFFQSVIGNEIKQQCSEKEGRLPDYVLACVGGGSNAIGAFYAFLDNPKVNLIGLEAGGEGVDTEKTAASLAKGQVMILHGKRQTVLRGKDGNVGQSFSIAAGLDYPGCGPEHCYLHGTSKATYVPVTDDEAVQAFSRLSRLEGIIPAIESAHAVAYLEELMPLTSADDIVVVNLSGRGDKDTERLLQVLT